MVSVRKLAVIFVALTLGAAAEAQTSLAVSIEPGKAYSHKVKFGIVSMNVTPQIAIWIETAGGKYADTIYVTRNAGTSAWVAAGSSRRPESLPVWSHARGVASSDGVYMPDKATKLPDSVSGASPKAGFAKTWTAPASLGPGKYRVRVELNSSFDWNEAYPDKLPKTEPHWSEVNGQPSVVYEGLVDLGSVANEVELAPIGIGSLRGEDGEVNADMKGLTTALELVASIKVEYRP
jgi:hypothetical protein